ncbi:hypothetical protein Pan241w_34110 [Gimesia alba]|uniref:LTXXQ motif protein n=1 Tax=Gimesia alba TaxID=2527973 RepID=A0A517RHF6_9PLAN|nr:hypothetical protein [Gimesia alba]QDT43311.1 hypothetical protein Pan241w_34110 [Gimesia alba]
MFQQKALKLFVVWFTGIALTICTADSVPAQKKAEDPAKSSAKETKTTRKKPKGRVPAHYGKLKLSKEQKDKIYSIRAEYKTQIDSLKKQLEALKEKEKQECETVLTADQKKDLTKFVAEAASKRKARSKN